MTIREYSKIELVSSEAESEAVKIALVNLRRDLIRTLNCSVVETVCKADDPAGDKNGTADKHANTSASLSAGNVIRILVGTVAHLAELDAKADIAKMQAEDGTYRKEAFLIQEKNGELLIAGTDRRGTIYGMYDFCEWLGVSPWYFFADVLVRRRSEAVIPENFCKVDYPSVEYRGIFINDEEELEHWVWRYMGEETIGVKTYEKIFELLLRLKINYIWPAMHVNSFNLKQENGALADRMGIVVGTSHCDMLMRSNNREWRPWLAKKGYTDVEYDFSIPGRNREILKEYWRESVEQNRDFEVSYTVGMRGIHDSGFETKSLEGLIGEALLKAKIELLESVMAAQEEILSETLDKEPMKTFVPYKEVLELYDNGLKVPEDLTLIWTNDNYGYVRRYPGEKEKARKSGNGIYYHNSYWAPPGASYLFLCSIPMAHTRNELLKAYKEGIQKVWVTNFGAIKPIEQQLSFYAKLAWEADGDAHRDLETFDETIFLTRWLDRMFSGQPGAKLAPLLLEFDQLTNARKLEHMDDDCFSQTAFGDEAAERMHQYEHLCSEIEAIYETLPAAEKDAFYQLVLMKVQAAYFTNGMYYYADRSRLCMRQGKNSDAKRYTDQSHAFDLARRKLLYYYNHVMSNGKWNGILTPEDFPPPRTAMYPACRVPLTTVNDQMIVTCWNNQSELTFTDSTHGNAKWIELANAGDGTLPYKIEMPEWLTIAGALPTEGTLTKETRFVFSVIPQTKSAEAVSVESASADEFDDAQSAFVRRGTITVFSGTQRSAVIPVTDETDAVDARVQQAAEAAKLASTAHVAIEDSGRCVIEAGNGTAVSELDEAGWKLIPHLGRSQGSLLEAKTAGAQWSCPLYLTQDGDFVVELHRFPTLNSVGHLRVGISVDNGAMLVFESKSNDEHRADWKHNILNNVDKLSRRIPNLTAGLHKLTFTAIDPYVSFTRAVLYDTKTAAGKQLAQTLEAPAKLVDGGYERSNLGMNPTSSAYELLPTEINLDAYCAHWYGDVTPEPRPVLYLPSAAAKDTLADDDIIIRPEASPAIITPQQILAKAASPVAEADSVIAIDAASALAQTAFASAHDSADGIAWNYCDSPSYGETGLAMYIEEEGFSWAATDAPSLRFTVQAEGGHYCIWVHTWQWGTDSSHYTVGIDGAIVPEKELYGGRSLWKYASEHVWKWAPVWECDLSEGQHEISVYSLSSRLRINQIRIEKI